jgi:hypothetical protein
MKSGSIFLFLMTISLQPGHAVQSGELGSGIAGLGNGISVHILTKAEPPERAPGLKFGNSYQVGNGVLHRSVTDAVNHSYFGYDLHVEPANGSKQCRVAILPLTTGPAGSRQAGSSVGNSATAGGASPVTADASWRPVFLPSYPGPQVVRDGDTIALDLLTTADGQQKVVDYIDISCNAPGNPAARDASLDDLQIALTDPTVYVDGTRFPGPAKGAHLNGSLVWFYLPGKGRFILSVIPRQDRGFVLAGTIHDKVIAFAFGNSRYEVKNTATVFGSGRLCNLYVLNEPSFESKSSPMFGSLTQLEGEKK